MSEYTYLAIPKKLYEADTIPLVGGVNEWEVVGINYYDNAIQNYIIKTETTKTSIGADEINKNFFLTYSEAALAYSEAMRKLKGETKDV